LPTPLAVPIDEFGRILDTISQWQAYRALWAMVDAAELITRFNAIVALLDVRQQSGETPEPLRKVLVNLLERPTFGAWRDIAHSAIEKLGTSTLVQELPDFWKQHWGPLFEGGSAEQSIIELRNRMAHTARLTDEEAQRLLDAHCERFEKAICALNFWASYRLIAVLSDGRAVRLHGVPDPQGWVLPEESNLPTDLSAYRERVVLLSQDGLGFSCYFPCSFITLCWSFEKGITKSWTTDLPRWSTCATIVSASYWNIPRSRPTTLSPSSSSETLSTIFSPSRSGAANWNSSRQHERNGNRRATTSVT
jgi:hypothetical protein